MLLGSLVGISLVGLIIVIVALFCLRRSSTITLPPEWLESDGDIEVVGRPTKPDVGDRHFGPSNTWPKCTKESPWDGRTLPVMHVDGDFLEDFNDLLRCPNCGYQWSIGPDV
jgi:hypothetical protein